MLAVLIVEDDPLLALDLEGTLAELGHRVCGLAHTASEACEAAALHEPDVILMDFNLADGSTGADAAVRIRRSSPVPIVFVTAQAHSDCRRRMAAISRARIVSQPHTPHMIASALNEVRAAHL